ncbi:hypothetical protein lerEdw1_004197 [Lerista edwardsae]|nr:hypothetical protein lerEdw1_004201 [Lerista edwardsae]KAJ6650743.1 hypothetical protein lerEdw1_004197 [Lerista edwardsae]
MKIVLGLITTCIVLALSHGYCFFSEHKAKIKEARNPPLLSEPLTDTHSPISPQGANMKVLLSLTVLCLSLAFCGGFCLYKQLRVRIRDGQLLEPKGCTDHYDKIFHPFGSVWNSSLCLRCDCQKHRLRCCTRYTDVGSTLECTPIVNSETCTVNLYEKDDPTMLCF